MLPSLLARDVQTGLKQFLVTAYEPSDDFFHGLVSRFVENEAAWMKGPFLQTGLPFRPGPAGKGFFEEFETQNPSYTHQEKAWQRLVSRPGAGNTIVATGTGSGKTECFLYPVLDHCSRALKAGERGVKALVIYPMNALATDQARRFAETVASTPAFSGLRVGLFIGGNVGLPGSGMVMSPTGVITDRETLRKTPPDVLLTNYKMLDYLLLRPKDRQLWARNSPTTLRYVVVDELHTFDGAQGTDLALLLRRLRARLQLPDGHLLCVGTSATLGGAADTAPLREYARQVFAAPFAEGAVVVEDRLSSAEFLGDETIEHFLQPSADLQVLLDPGRYARQEDAVAAWCGVFFPELPAPANVTDRAWRTALAGHLKRHLLFVNLLKLMKKGVVEYGDLLQQLQGPLPADARPHVRLVLDALLVLVAWARADDGGRPFVNLRLQVWIRELRRMVARVAADPASVELRPEAELAAKPGGLYLPIVQCSECHTTGWLSRVAPGSSKASAKLDEIYNTWFGRRSEAVRLYPGRKLPTREVDGRDQHLCAACGNLQVAGGKCDGCGHTELVAVFRTTGIRQSTKGNAAFAWHDTTCPTCGARDRLLLVGARNATLGSQLVEQSWASGFNDDKKLIAFSDSVQDAAHRAGFFGARTYANTVRTGLAKVIDQLATPTVQWPQFLQGLERLVDDPRSSLHLSPEDFVAEFIGPDMTWQRDWANELVERNRLPPGSRLPERVRKRLGWQAYSEFTYLSHRGRNLDRIGKATLAVPLATVIQAAAALTPALREKLGLSVSETVVARWLWGFLAHLRRRGAVLHPELETYAENGNVWSLLKSHGRSEWMPWFGNVAPRPVFLTLGHHRDFDRLAATKKTWFTRWATVTLGQESLLPEKITDDLYGEAIRCLVDLGALVRTTGMLGDSIALAPEALVLSSDVVQLRSRQGKRRLTVPTDAAALLVGMPCLDALHDVYDEAVPVDGWLAERFSKGDLRRVIPAEHTGLLEADVRQKLEERFKSRSPRRWFENLLSATPTLELGVDIGDLSSVLLCSVPPTQASYLQRVGRAGRRDGNALTTTLAEGSSPHDLYFFEDVLDMIAGDVEPPGIFLKAAEVLRRQLAAFCLDDWVTTVTSATSLPDKTSPALDAVERADKARFPYTFLDHVLANEPQLAEAFIALLGEDIDDRVRDRLTEFLRGTGEGDGLRVRLLKTLEELVEERKLYKRRADQIKTLIAAAEARPRDEATTNEINKLRRERDKVLELTKEINQRDLLNTLTDAGLIPNYAFPEAGIELKSVLWRRKSSDDHTPGAYVALPAIRYERPASSALSEFAPENRFYANQRRVEIDQINMGLAKLEWWRLCPACHHMENLDVHADASATCPRCGDAMWSDQAQKRQLLRFRQAIANSDDTRVRIDDSADDREPKFYVRQLLADFEAKDIREAWKLSTPALPFGFEFIARVTFRDINFGELSKPGDIFRVADQNTQRPGFTLCRTCGKVQTPRRPRNQNAPAQDHSFECPQRDSDDPANLVECLYLYREFTSEALRILVPYTRAGMNADVVQSFMAALQLGLKKQFGGRVDHLRMTLQDEPGRDGGPRRQYIVLYDSVPGGTGYLHQLLAQDAGTLSTVLRMALNAVKTCACHADPEKDGCYRCVYQYRMTSKMNLVSRDLATQVLTDLVGALDGMERVPTVSEIFINPRFDSALEERFIESLTRLGGVDGLPVVKLVQEVVFGKSGYLLEVGSERYWIEPQRNVGASDGVAVASCPDFMLWPANSRSPRRPIAVFCDGWTYHQNSLREDAAKRTALVASGQFWVWSVTHEDVKDAIGGGAGTDLESPTTLLNHHAGAQAPPSVPRAEAQAFNRNAVAQLLSWLAQSPGDVGDKVVTQLKRNTVWATFLMVPHPGSEGAAVVASAMTALAGRLPDWMREVPKPHALARSRGGEQPMVAFWWPSAFSQPGMDLPLTPGLLVLDEAGASNDSELHLHWRRWLALFNTFQVLPGFVLATETGIAAGDLAALAPSTVALPVPGPGAAGGLAWDSVFKAALADVADGLRRLADTGADVPEVGYELPDSQGVVVAEAELAWPRAKVCVLLVSQEEFAAAWAGAGWRPVLLASDWSDTVSRMLREVPETNS
jgi:DEAD/DEAH box helicase domain-containing protein